MYACMYEGRYYVGGWVGKQISREIDSHIIATVFDPFSSPVCQHPYILHHLTGSISCVSTCASLITKEHILPNLSLNRACSTDVSVSQFRVC